LRLPILITQIGSLAVERSGETLDISSAGVSFELLNELQPGERIEYLITLSSSVHDVKLRCLGKVLRSVRPDGSNSRVEIAVTIDRYHFVRAEQMEAMPAAI
jgi:hypothetical protein